MEPTDSNQSLPENEPNPAPTVTPTDTKRREVEIWHTVSDALSKLDQAAQARVLRSVITLFEIPLGPSPSGATTAASGAAMLVNPPFSGAEDRSPSPKEFLHDKRPSTDVDKIACLGYYLTHYRNTPHFKTLDLSQLNTEAAQVKFSNAAQAVENSAQAGLLVPAVKGQKQLSAAGELYVQALPDKTAARAAIEGYRRKRNKRQGLQTKPNGDANE